MSAFPGLFSRKEFFQLDAREIALWMKLAERKKITSMIDLADAFRLGMSDPKTYKEIMNFLNRFLAGESIQKAKDDIVRENWESLKRMKRG